MPGLRVAGARSRAGKAIMLNNILHADFDPDYLPAQLIQPSPGDLHWFVDEAAAKLLPVN
jgi:6-phosphogluconolactonase